MHALVCEQYTENASILSTCTPRVFPEASVQVGVPCFSDVCPVPCPPWSAVPKTTGCSTHRIEVFGHRLSAICSWTHSPPPNRCEGHSGCQLSSAAILLICLRNGATCVSPGASNSSKGLMQPCGISILALSAGSPSSRSTCTARRTATALHGISRQEGCADGTVSTQPRLMCWRF